MATESAPLNYSVARELQLTLESFGIRWPAMGSHIPCIAYVIWLTLGEFMSSLAVNGCTKCWEAHEHNQQLGEIYSPDIAKSQRLCKEGNARINTVSAIRPGFAKIFEKVCIPSHFERPETDLHIAENAQSIDYTDTWSTKRVHWLSKSQTMNCNTIYSWCESTVEFNSGVPWTILPITRIHLQVAQESKIQPFLATVHNTGWMEHQ